MKFSHPQYSVYEHERQVIPELVLSHSSYFDVTVTICSAPVNISSELQLYILL